MSWYKKSINKPKANIAKKDIIVYKSLTKISNKSYDSIYYWHRYVINKLQPRVNINVDLVRNEKLSLISLNTYMISAGYHSYRKLTKKIRNSFFLFISNEVIVKCIIPAGTIYYVSDNEIVSETIKVIEEVI